MNTSGHETESAVNSESTTTSSSTPNLQGLTIFVYVVSILMGIAAGLLISGFINGGIFHWPGFMRYISPISGLVGGLLAAKFWTALMTRHIHNQLLPWKIFFLGILWGLLAGWIAACILWLIEGCFLTGIALSGNGMYFRDDFFIGALFGIGFFGSIGGLVAGLVYGGVWAIWTRSRK